MKERPIIMSAESVQAILDGRKTQTRRVVKNQPKEACGFLYTTKDEMFKNPYGQKGDRLWVKETFSNPRDELIIFKSTLQEDIEKNHWENTDIKIKWASPLFMPRCASRITLEITNIRVERLQDITGEDAIAEGIAHIYGKYCEHIPRDAVRRYSELWNELNAKRGYSWESNPFVWVIQFKRIEQ